MKKYTQMIATTIAVLSLFILVGCGNKQEIGNSLTETPTTTQTESESTTPTATETEGPHEHSYTESITLAETCDVDGEKTFTCSCGDKYTEPITAKGHTYVADESTKKNPTCSKEGKEADKTCSTCGHKAEGATISPTAHNYGSFVYNNDATQSADGTKTRKCSACGKVDTQTASGTKLPFDPYSLRAVTSLNDIPVVGTLTNANSDYYYEIRSNIEAGKYEKIRYVASNGDQFCMWNVRLADDRDKEIIGQTSYYWFMAPKGDEFSSGYVHSNLTGIDTAFSDKHMIAVGRNISGSINESMLNAPSLPLSYREVYTSECPVTLYQIVETDNMISVWVESTNCGQEGIGTCGSFNCTGTCLRSKTLDKLRALPLEKGWTSGYAGGENGRINWNGKLLVNFYYLKY